MTIDVNGTITKSSASNFIVIQEKLYIQYCNVTERLPERNITLKGYFHSRRYFDESEGELRKDFTFMNSTMDSAHLFLRNITPSEWNVFEHKKVVIHVRRTDMDFESHVNRGWTRIESDFFQRAMQYFKLQHSHVLFVVLSDDIEWCRNNIMGSHVFYSQGHTPATDLAIASLCDHAIITKGTYSLWVAWLANGVTVRPQNYPKPNTTMYDLLKSETHYFPRYSVVL